MNSTQLTLLIFLKISECYLSNAGLKNSNVNIFILIFISLFIGRVIKLNIIIYQQNNFLVKGTCVQFVVPDTSTGTSGNIVRINTREFISIHVLFALNSSMTR